MYICIFWLIMQIKRKNCEITVVKISQILIVALTRRQKGAEPETDVVTIMRRCAVHVYNSL